MLTTNCGVGRLVAAELVLAVFVGRHTEAEAGAAAAEGGGDRDGMLAACCSWLMAAWDHAAAAGPAAGAGAGESC